MHRQSMVDLGPVTPDDEALLQWSETTQANNTARLESGAETITKLVTGLYGVLFAVLAFADAPAYLAQPGVQQVGALAIVLFFGALIAALVAQYPFHSQFRHGNLTDIAAVKRRIVDRKARALSVALFLFLTGTGALGALLILLLYQPLPPAAP